ncbi:MAG TPA: alkaline phosphatase family protein [Gemmatimonadaceae bacterium]|nr:alkaline phosphatase family protein [Gemmatimonadaceae bacterium]
MPTPTAIRRVIIVVLDGLRPDAIDAFDLSNIRAMALSGASSLSARTVSPSCTWPAITSLLSGLPPETHGILRDSAHVPRPRTRLEPLPALLSRADYHTSVFMRALPVLYRGTARLIAKGLGFAEARFAGATAEEVTMAASKNLRSQDRGLVVLHWADADQAGEAHGWMTAEYGEACRRLDSAFGLLTKLTSCNSDPHTLVIALADHGGGGVTVNDHCEEHPLNWTIPLILGGGSVKHTTLEEAHLLDVPATAAWALGVPRPAGYVGRVLIEAIATDDEQISEAAAVA